MNVFLLLGKLYDLIKRLPDFMPGSERFECSVEELCQSLCYYPRITSVCITVFVSLILHKVQHNVYAVSIYLRDGLTSLKSSMVINVLQIL